MFSFLSELTVHSANSPEHVHFASLTNSMELSGSIDDKIPCCLYEDSGFGSTARCETSQFEIQNSELRSKMTPSDALDLRTNNDRTEKSLRTARSIRQANRSCIYEEIHSTDVTHSNLDKPVMSTCTTKTESVTNDLPMDYSNRFISTTTTPTSNTDQMTGVSGSSIEFLAAFCAAAMTRQTALPNLRPLRASSNHRTPDSPDNLHLKLNLPGTHLSDSPRLLENVFSGHTDPDWLQLRPVNETATTTMMMMMNQPSVIDMLNSRVPVCSSPVKFTDPSTTVTAVDENFGLDEDRSHADDLHTPPNSTRAKQSEDYLDQFMRVDQSQNVLWRQLAERFQRTLAPNQCGVCNKVLSCRSALTMHYRVHTGK